MTYKQRSAAHAKCLSSAVEYWRRRYTRATHTLSRHSVVAACRSIAEDGSDVAGPSKAHTRAETRARVAVDAIQLAKALGSYCGGRSGC